VFRLPDGFLQRKPVHGLIVGTAPGHEVIVYCADPALRERFLGIAYGLKSMTHPGVLPVLEVIDTSEHAAWIEPASAAIWPVVRHPPTCPAEFVAWIRPLIEALAEAHENGAVHGGPLKFGVYQGREVLVELARTLAVDPGVDALALRDLVRDTLIGGSYTAQKASSLLDALEACVPMRDLDVYLERLAADPGLPVPTASLEQPWVSAALPLRRVTTIGRDADNDLRIEDRKIGPQHARIWYDGSWYISCSGYTIVRGAPVARAELHDRNEVVFGETQYQFRTG
jgi:hypothetical protein